MEDQCVRQPRIPVLAFVSRGGAQALECSDDLPVLHQHARQLSLEPPGQRYDRRHVGADIAPCDFRKQAQRRHRVNRFPGAVLMQQTRHFSCGVAKSTRLLRSLRELRMRLFVFSVQCSVFRETGMCVFMMFSPVDSPSRVCAMSGALYDALELTIVGTHGLILTWARGGRIDTDPGSEERARAPAA